MNLMDYDWIVLNSSGGKDSQTMIEVVYKMAVSQGFRLNRIVVAHADLGRVEWTGTKDLAERQAKHYGLEFQAIARPQGDLLNHIESRGMWPSSTSRYCTSDHKRGQIGKIITDLGRRLPGTIRVLNCMGLRAQESPARSKKVALVHDKRNSTQRRHVDTWLPILDWTEDQVWASIKETGVEYHKAYDLGMPRLSCVFCVFAPKAALIIAGKHNPELLQEYVRVEAKIEHTFRQGLSIAEVAKAVEADEPVEAMDGNWNM